MTRPVPKRWSRSSRRHLLRTYAAPAGQRGSASALGSGVNVGDSEVCETRALFSGLS